MNTTEFAVTGMTCGHCTAAVTKEVSALVNVHSVEVDLATGTVTVTSEGPVDQAALAAAIDEAGFELAQ